LRVPHLIITKLKEWIALELTLLAMTTWYTYIATLPVIARRNVTKQSRKYFNFIYLFRTNVAKPHPVE